MPNMLSLEIKLYLLLLLLLLLLSLLEILGEALRIRIIIIISQNRRLVPPVSLVRPTFAGTKL